MDPWFRTCDTHSIIDLATSERVNPAAHIGVMNRVWIEESVKVYKRATMGSGSIIGSGATVTQKIPENVVATGIPARIIKENVTWLKERI